MENLSVEKLDTEANIYKNIHKLMSLDFELLNKFNNKLTNSGMFDEAEAAHASALDEIIMRFLPSVLVN